MRNREWLKHAIDTTQRIKELKQCSPLGYYTSPEEYMEILEDFTKLIFPLNQVSDEAANQFHETEKSFERFKNNLCKHCDILLKEYEKVKVDE
jgi:hypothetical protein